MSFSVSDIISWIGGRVVNETALQSGSRAGSQDIRIERPASLRGSTAKDVAFLFSKAFQSELPEAAPGALITGEPFVLPLEQASLPLWKNSAVIACSDPHLAMAKISEQIAPDFSTVTHTKSPEKTNIHPSAVVDPSAKLGDRVVIGAHSVIEAGVKIGNGTVIYPGCYIGFEASIGENTVLFANVSIYEWTQIGSRVRLHSGVVLGADGFGYVPEMKNGEVVNHQKIYHLGKVVLGDDVEMGANSSVDRGTFSDTVIKNKVKLDNLVQIGHNSELGEGTIICGHSGTAGSVVVGKFVTVGGCTGINNKVTIGDRAMVAAFTSATKDIKPGTVVAGVPQRNARDHFKVHALLTKLLKSKEATKGSRSSEFKEK